MLLILILLQNDLPTPTSETFAYNHFHCAVSLPKQKFCQSYQNTLEKLSFSRSALFQVKTRVVLKYSVSDCLRKPVFDSNSSQTPSKLISLTILVTLRRFTLF